MSARSVKYDRYILLASVFALLLLGRFFVFSASSVYAFSKYGDSFFFVKKDLAWVLVEVAGLIIFSKIDYRRLEKMAFPFLLLAILLLVMVLIPGLGNNANGASRWLNLGFIKFQPSELAKAAVIIYAAFILTIMQRKVRDFRLLVPPLMFILAILAPVMLQKDLGTALTIAITAGLMMYVGGVRPWSLIQVGGLGTLLVSAFIFFVDYRRARFLAFLNPWADPTDKGFQIVQGLIAIGSGGIFGKGVSRQKFFFVPNPHTDYIFAIMAEERGLILSVIVLVLYVLIIFTAIRIALRCKDRFGMLVASGIASLIAVQALINIGGVTASIPLTGVPLPFLSYGGSSLLTLMSGVGILLNIASPRKLKIVGKRKNESTDIDRRHRRASVSRNSSRAGAVRKYR